MLAGMLSVLLVAGVIGLGVFIATDEPPRRAAPVDAATAAPPAPAQATPTADADGRRGPCRRSSSRP